jgi:D-beta-D-heptose 7-phosphate kinase/D-beta-D-heptose 1-phosphate adenosyltransferase
MEKKRIVVAVCGGFDPIHVGHVRHFKEAKALGDELVVMLNTDTWLMEKKGYVFMKFDERREIIESIRHVDRVVPYVETESGSVAKTLEKYRPDIFAKGGDRTKENIPQDEVDTCKRVGVELVTGVGGEKIQSSSWLVDKAIYKKTDSLKMVAARKTPQKVSHKQRRSNN